MNLKTYILNFFNVLLFFVSLCGNEALKSAPISDFAVQYIRDDEYIEIADLSREWIDSDKPNDSLFVVPGRSGTPFLTLLKLLYGEEVGRSIPFSNIRSDGDNVWSESQWKTFFLKFLDAKTIANKTSIKVFDFHMTNGRTIAMFKKLFERFVLKEFPQIKNIEFTVASTYPDKAALDLPGMRIVDLTKYPKLGVNLHFQHYDIKAEYEEYQPGKSRRLRKNPYHLKFKQSLASETVKASSYIKQKFADSSFLCNLTLAFSSQWSPPATK